MIDDGFLHVFQCPRWLADGGGPERHCGYLSAHPGVCPYDHGEPIKLVEIVATVQCSDCSMPIPADDGRSPDGRLVCGECQLGYVRVNLKSSPEESAGAARPMLGGRPGAASEKRP